MHVSVMNAIVLDLTLYYMQRTPFAVCCFYLHFCPLMGGKNMDVVSL